MTQRSDRELLRQLKNAAADVFHLFYNYDPVDQTVQCTECGSWADVGDRMKHAPSCSVSLLLTRQQIAHERCEGSLDVDEDDEDLPSSIGLTEEETRYYFRHNGTRCPFCHSGKIEEGPIEVGEIEPDDARQEVWCLEPDCGAVWVDEYKLNSVAVRYGPKDRSS